MKVKVVVPGVALGERDVADERLAAPRPQPAVETTMSSTPIHSSLPTAFVVMTRTSTSGWLSAAAGSTTQTGVTRVGLARPVVASATNAAGTFVKSPAGAHPEVQRDRLDGVVDGAVDVAQVVRDA